MRQENNELIERAKLILPNMPDEVFDSFMAPLIINDIGWPFLTAGDSLAGTDWHRILYPLSLSFFCQLRWKITKFYLNKEDLYQDSICDINWTIINKTEDVWALIGRDSKPSRDSLAWHKQFIMMNGRLCTPVALAYTSSGIKVLDGIHRMAALLDLSLNDKLPIDAWIGE